MKPYYEHAGITIYHGDCREVLKEIEPVDLLLTDPPYGIGYDARGGGGGVNSKSKAPRTRFHIPTVAGDDEPFDVAPLIGLASRHMIWGAHVFFNQIPAGWRLLVWKKRESGPASEMDFADGEICADSGGGLLRILDHRHNGFMRDLGDMKHPIHPTQKPLSVMKWCLGFAVDAKTILDPFMGSGTTLRAAKDLGLKAIGIELEEKYCEIAAKRLEQEVFQFD